MWKSAFLWAKINILPVLLSDVCKVSTARFLSPSLNVEGYSINLLVCRNLKAFKEGSKLTPNKMQLNFPLLWKFYLHSYSPSIFPCFFFMHIPLPTSLFHLLFLFFLSPSLIILTLFPSHYTGFALGYYPIYLEYLGYFIQINVCIFSILPFTHRSEERKEDMIEINCAPQSK